VLGAAESKGRPRESRGGPAGSVSAHRARRSRRQSFRIFSRPSRTLRVALRVS
jgi:hypothetical protein